MTDEFLNTKFGKARVNNKGYYIITSGKEGNNGKSLHLLIFEDFYGEIPDGYIVHHKDGNPQNNCILNLQLMRRNEHVKLHHIGSKRSVESKKKMSEAQKGHFVSENARINRSKFNNTVGYFRVCKKKCPSCKQGFIYRYQFKENGKYYYVESVSLENLEKKVNDKNWIWRKL